MSPSPSALSAPLPSCLASFPRTAAASVTCYEAPRTRWRRVNENGSQSRAAMKDSARPFKQGAFQTPRGGGVCRPRVSALLSPSVGALRAAAATQFVGLPRGSGRGLLSRVARPASPEVTVTFRPPASTRPVRRALLNGTSCSKSALTIEQPHRKSRPLLRFSVFEKRGALGRPTASISHVRRISCSARIARSVLHRAPLSATVLQ